MGLSIHTNFASLTTQSQLNSTNKMLGTAMQRLGTGLRINSAADDAAGLQMATRLQAQSSGQKVGMRNAQDAVSMMQTAEGAMDEMSNIVQRMKDLATQSANGTSTADDRKAMDAEFVELRNELDNITNNTTFGGQNLLKTGFQGDVTFQIGGTADEKLELKSTGTLAKALAEVVGSGKGTQHDQEPDADAGWHVRAVQLQPDDRYGDFPAALIAVAPISRMGAFFFFFPSRFRVISSFSFLVFSS